LQSRLGRALDGLQVQLAQRVIGSAFAVEVHGVRIEFGVGVGGDLELRVVVGGLEFFHDAFEVVVPLELLCAGGAGGRIGRSGDKFQGAGEGEHVQRGDVGGELFDRVEYVCHGQ